MGIRQARNIKIVNRRAIPSAASIFPTKEPTARDKITVQALQWTDMAFECSDYRLNQKKLIQNLEKQLKDKLYNPKLWEKGKINIVFPPKTKLSNLWTPIEFDISMYEKGKKSESSLFLHIRLKREFVADKGYRTQCEISNVRSEEIPAVAKAPIEHYKTISPFDLDRLNDLYQRMFNNPKVQEKIDILGYAPRIGDGWYILPYVENFMTDKIFLDRTTTRKLMTKVYNLGTVASKDPKLANLSNTEDVHYSHFIMYRKYQKNKTQSLITVKAVKTALGGWDLFVVGAEPYK